MHLLSGILITAIGLFMLVCGKMQWLDHPREGRKETADTGKRIEVNRFVIDQSGRVGTLDEQEIDLTTAEFELLWLLSVHTGRVVSRHRLHQELLGLKYDGQDRSIDLRVSRLRRKLKDDPNRPQLVKSVRRVGYSNKSRGMRKKVGRGRENGSGTGNRLLCEVHR